MDNIGYYDNDCMDCLIPKEFCPRYKLDMCKTCEYYGTCLAKPIMCNTGLCYNVICRKSEEEQYD